MKQLAELPYRFWPEARLPDGVKHSRFTNVKSAEFKKSYTKRVNPVLKAAGFTCKSTVARREDEKLWRMVWYGTGNANGSGVVAIAAHIPGLPSSGGVAYTVDSWEVYGACFKHHLQLAPGQAWFDLGRTAEESLETAGLMAEAFETEGRAYLELLEIAEEILLGVAPCAGWLETMAEHRKTFGLELGHTIAPNAEAAEFLARLNVRAGRPDRGRQFAELGIVETEHIDATSHPYHAFRVRFEKLVAGVRTFDVDAADRAEIERRIAAARAT